MAHGARTGSTQIFSKYHKMPTDFTVTCTVNITCTIVQAPRAAAPTQPAQPTEAANADARESKPRPAGPLPAPESLSAAERTIMGLVQGETIF